ncbi:hypothetical protein GHT06_020847 [Daphnia sinensis]|uniref:Uncharacterized protein n=1 Tax=Daphnia sinensis TaxID=1820382 RepID=A0AAD5PN86_9CRUS|nr:hypothetical protein GHT06_020847 [Daphnia sinensis]
MEWHVTSDRLSSADASDGNVNNFGRNDRLELLRHATGRLLALRLARRARRRFTEAVRTQDHVRNALWIGVSLDLERAQRTPLQMRRTGIRLDRTLMMALVMNFTPDSNEQFAAVSAGRITRVLLRVHLPVQINWIGNGMYGRCR